MPLLDVVNGPIRNCQPTGQNQPPSGDFNGYVRKGKVGWHCAKPEAGSSGCRRLSECTAIKILGEFQNDKKGTRHDNANPEFQGTVIVWVSIEVEGGKRDSPLVDVKLGERRECR
jgi:hypothetical protein